MVEYIGDHSDGDLRSAINDLELVARGEMEISAKAVESIGARDRESSVYVALQEIFRSGDARRARESTRNLDESPEDLILWIDENLPVDYRRDDDLERGLRALGRDLSLSFRRSFVGRDLPVLALREVRPDGRLRALSDNFIDLGLDLGGRSAGEVINRLLTARITHASEDGAFGRIV